MEEDAPAAPPTEQRPADPNVEQPQATLAGFPPVQEPAPMEALPLAVEEEEAEDSETENEDAVDEEQLLLDYHRLNWTRLMVIDGYA